jgi:Double-GTPase 2
MSVAKGLFYAVVLTIVAAVSLGILAGAAALSLLLGVSAFWRAATEFLRSTRSVEHLNLDAPADPADYGYLAGPVLRDHRQLAGIGFARVYRRILGLPDGVSSKSLLAWLLRRRWVEAGTAELAVLFPFVGMAAGFIAGFLGAAVFVAATLLVQSVILVSVVGGVRLTARTLRLLEAGMLALRGITTECGSCHQRLTRPVLVCPCGRAHRDLMPGKQGTFRRTCRCTRRLPTLLMLGKWRLESRCGHCGAPLPRRVQSVPTYHLPIVGGVASGKSVFMHTAVARLCQDGEHTVELADELTASRFARGQEYLRKGSFVPQTLFGQPVAYTIQFGPHLLYFYDAAGEVLERSQHMAVSSFVELSDGLVLVIDPFALPAVRARVDARTRCEAKPSEADPKEVLDGLVQTLREYRGTSSAVLALRVAVVITKADALLAVPNLRHPYLGLPADTHARTAAVRRWLVDQGHSDVVSSLHNHFSEVRYFIVTYLDHTAVASRQHVDGGPPVANDDPAAPVRWLLTGDRP